MSERCKYCQKEVKSGIWMSPQFRDEKVLLFCANKCQEEFIKMKLKRIKVNYPAYYQKLKKVMEKNEINKKN